MEKKEPVYRIKVEIVDEGDEPQELHKALKEGIECNGFALLLKKEKGGTVSMHNVSNIDLAQIMAVDGDLMASSLVALAMREGKKYIVQDRFSLCDVLKHAIP